MRRCRPSAGARRWRRWSTRCATDGPAPGWSRRVGAIGAIVAEHFPKTADDLNELPDRLIEL